MGRFVLQDEVAMIWGLALLYDFPATLVGERWDIHLFEEKMVSMVFMFFFYSNNVKLALAFQCEPKRQTCCVKGQVKSEE